MKISAILWKFRPLSNKWKATDGRHAGHGSGVSPLAFSFANRFKVVLEVVHPERPMMLYYVEPLNASALIEVRRVLKQTFIPQALSAEEFEKNSP